MRVTDRMLFEQARLRTGQSREDLEKSIHQASTGLRVEKPGDDPTAAAQIVNKKQNLDRYAAIQTTAQRAADELNAADGAFGEVTNALFRAKELVVQLRNDTYSADDRKTAVPQIDGILRNMVAALNTKVGDRYIFGGFVDNIPPFAVNGVYSGDTNVRKVELAQGQLEDASIRADVAIKGVGGGVDILQTLRDLSLAFNNNDVAGIDTAMANLDAGFNQVQLSRAKAGTGTVLFEAAVSASQLAGDAEIKALSDLQDIDAIEAASKLALAERALDAALTASARGFRLTLLDKLG